MNKKGLLTTKKASSYSFIGRICLETLRALLHKVKLQERTNNTGGLKVLKRRLCLKSCSFRFLILVMTLPPGMLFLGMFQ